MNIMKISILNNFRLQAEADNNSEEEIEQEKVGNMTWQAVLVESARWYV